MAGASKTDSVNLTVSQPTQGNMKDQVSSLLDDLALDEAVGDELRRYAVLDAAVPAFLRSPAVESRHGTAQDARVLQSICVRLLEDLPALTSLSIAKDHTEKSAEQIVKEFPAHIPRAVRNEFVLNYAQCRMFFRGHYVPKERQKVHSRLLQQGCDSPDDHINGSFEEHQCPMRLNRLQGLREIESWKTGRLILPYMTAKLPDELVVKIIELVVVPLQPCLRLDDENTLSAVARALIGEHPPCSQDIEAVAEEAILKYSVIAVDVTFQGDRANKVAILPHCALDLKYPIRHLELSFKLKLPYGRVCYPSNLLSATSGMPSLLSQLPGLQTLRLILTVDKATNPADRFATHPARDEPLNTSCRTGFAGTTTIKEVVAGLLDAAMADRSLSVSFCLRYESAELATSIEENQFVHSYRIDIGDRSGLEVVEEADSRSTWGKE